MCGRIRGRWKRRGDGERGWGHHSLRRVHTIGVQPDAAPATCPLRIGSFGSRCHHRPLHRPPSPLSVGGVSEWGVSDCRVVLSELAINLCMPVCTSLCFCTLERYQQRSASTKYGPTCPTWPHVALYVEKCSLSDHRQRQQDESVHKGTRNDLEDGDKPNRITGGGYGRVRECRRVLHIEGRYADPERPFATVSRSLT